MHHRPPKLARWLRWTLVCWFVVAAVGAVTAEPGSPPIQREPWQTDGTDGANCLFVFLQLHRQPVAHAAVLQAMANNGISSLETLQPASGRFDVPVQVVQVKPTALEQVPLPAIAQLSQKSPGNFVLLTDVATDRVRVLDGRTGQVEVWPRLAFEQQWNGSLLVARESRWAAALRWTVYVASVLCGSMVLGLLAWRKLFQRKRPPLRVQGPHFNAGVPADKARAGA